jgi:formylglycine-generating enzyme required for sulfatase activity
MYYEPKSRDVQNSSQSEQKYYQLTHDYLVPSLRDWLTRKQKETRRGRAELLLADRATVWNARPENRQLPSLLQWFQIRWLTQKKTWTSPQRNMIMKAGRYHVVRGLVLAVLLIAGSLVGLGIRSQVIEQNKATRAAGLVQAVLNAETAQVTAIIDEMAEYRPWADPLLHQENEKAAANSRQKLHTSLAFLRVDATQVDYLVGRLLDAEPHEVPVIRDALAPHKDQLLEKLWSVVEQPAKGKESQRLRAASALATYEPNSQRWTNLSGQVVDDLVSVNPVFLGLWSDQLRPVKTKFLKRLSVIFRDHQPERGTERTLATNLLADYAKEDPQILADLLMDADEKQFAVVYPKFKDHGKRGLVFLRDEVSMKLPSEGREIFKKPGTIAQTDAKVKISDGQSLAAKVFEVRLQAGKTYFIAMNSKDLDSFLVLQDKTGKELAFDDDRGGDLNALLVYTATEEDTYKIYTASLKGTGSFLLIVVETVSEDGKERLAKRQANAAVALLKMNQPETVWPMLKHSPDPRVRSYLIHQFGPLGADARAIVKHLHEEPDLTIRRALILSLGVFGEKEFSLQDRKRLLPKLQDIYRNDSDPGLHASSEWLLRTWKEEDWLKQMIDELAEDKEQREKKLDDIKQMLVKDREKMPPQWYVNGRGQTMVVIAGPVAFLMGSPTTEADRHNDEPQHKRRIGRTFAIAAKSVTVEQYRQFNKGYGLPEMYTRTTDLPMVGIDWYMAAEYCNRLSQEEGLELCYETDANGRVTKLKEHYLSLSGYRLPTETEMEFATRAGALTSRYYGETEELLPKYAWFTKNSKEKTWPVGSLKPNDFGLFDVQGNVFTWCQEKDKSYRSGNGEAAIDDQEDELVVNGTDFRVLRGGSSFEQASNVRSARHLRTLPTNTGGVIGFRVARTFMP